MDWGCNTIAAVRRPDAHIRRSESDKVANASGSRAIHAPLPLRRSRDATMVAAHRDWGEERDMPRRPVPVTETKEEKFQRLANLRTNIVLDYLRKLGSLSNKSHYKYSEDEVILIFDTIDEAVAEAKSRFLGRTRREFRL